MSNATKNNKISNLSGSISEAQETLRIVNSAWVKSFESATDRVTPPDAERVLLEAITDPMMASFVRMIELYASEKGKDTVDAAVEFIRFFKTCDSAWQQLLMQQGITRVAEKASAAQQH